MEFNWFTRVIARVVLASYVTQVFAPVVYAMEVERHSGGFAVGQPGLRDPSPPREKILQRSFQQSLGFKPRVETLKPSSNRADIDLDEDKARLEAEAYQYRLRVKTYDLSNERFQLKLSRKEKGSEGSFERLHTATIRQGKLSSSSSKEEKSQDDALLNLFKGSAVHRFVSNNETICFSWEIGNNVTLKIARDGSVFFDQGSVPLLSAYDLILKTSGELFLESLGVEKLTLQSPKTQVIGAVVADHLHISHAVTNEGGLQVKQLTGQGTVINHALLKLEGTVENPAILGVRKVLNEKNKAIDKEAKIESPHLRITSDNEFFLNAKGSELKFSGTLVASPLKNHDANTQPHPSFINKGEISLGEGAIIRDSVANYGLWKAHQLWVLGKNFTNTKDATLKIFKKFGTSAFLLNEGEIDAKLINMENGTNTGWIKGDGLHLTVWQNMVNNGIANLQHITGKGSLINQGSLKVQGTEENPTYIGINRFVNQKHEDSAYAPKVEGKYVKALARNDYDDQNPQNLEIQGLHIQSRIHNSSPDFFSNRSFHNAAQAEIDVDNLVVGGSAACSNISCGSLFTNEGAIRTKIGEICRDETRNLGNLTADKLVIKATNFTNDHLANIKVFDELSLNILNKSCRNLEGALLNKGNIEGKKIRIAAKEHTFRLLPNDMDSASPVARMFEIYWKGLLGVYLKEGTLVCKTHKKEEIAILKNTYGPTSSRGIPADVFSRVEEAVKNQSYPSLEDQNEVLKFALLRGYTPISSLELYNNGQIKAKALEVHNPIANSGEIIAKKVHGLGHMVNFSEGKVHATHLLDLASVTNKGKISGHKLNLKTKEFLMNLSSGEVQAKSLRSGSTLTNKGKIFGERLTTGKLVNFGETEARDISLWEGQNTGTIIGSKLNVGNEMISSGQVVLNELSGGKFTNHNSLKMAATEERAARISIRDFYNESTQTTLAKVLGNQVTVTDANKSFINKANSEILVNHLVFSMLETGSFSLMGYNSETGKFYGNEECSRFSNHGIVKTDILDVTRDYLGNFGKIETLEFKVRGHLFENDDCWLDNNSRALLHVGQSIKAETNIFNNRGEIFVDNGSFTQESGIFNNSGLWNDQGDINLGTTFLRNKGEIRWQKGIWRCEEQKPEDPTQLCNQGTWILDQIRGSRIPRMHNTGLLSLNNGAVEFDAVINEANIILSGGQHKIVYFYNDHLLSFLDQDWFFSDDFFNTNTMLNHLQVGKYDGPGEIEVEKNLTYDLHTLPKLIRSNGDVSFSKRHSQGRTLADLEKVSANGKVSFYTPAITTTQDYEFGNFGHLALYVDGLFTTHHSFKAPALTLEANGPLTCGASNQVMGIIAATKGPLTVTAHSIDDRFGKFYGDGPTVVKSTKGDILVGAAVQKGADFANRLGCAHEYNDIPRNVWVYTTVNDVNGAYISSNSTLDINANSSLILDYGQVFSSGNATFSALKNISAIRSIIRGTSTAHWEAPSILFGRAPAEAMHLYMTPWYPDVISYAAKSDRTEVHFTDSIWFDTQGLTNQAATISSGKSIYMLYNGQYLDLSEASKRPPTLTMANYAHKSSFFFSPVIQAGDTIQINIGGAVITGTMNSPIIEIELSGNALFHNGSRTRASIDLSKPFFFNLTKGIQKKVPGDGLLRITANNEVQTEFPLGTPYMDGGKRVMFVTPENQHLYQTPLDPSRIFNPLGSLSGDFLNLYIQSTLSELIGKVAVKGANGNNLKALTAHADEFVEETGKALVTQEDLERTSLARSMLLYGLEQVGNMIHQQMILCVTPQDINDVVGLSGDDIRIHVGGDLSFQNYEVVAENDIDLFAKGNLSILTVLKRLFGEDGYQDIIDGPTTKIISKRGNVKAIGKNGFQMRGATLRGLYRVVAGSTEGNTSIENVLLEKAVIKKETEDGGLFGDDKVTTTTEITTTSQPSFIESVKAVVEVLCGNKDKTTITGSHIKALQAIKFMGGKVETNASVGVNKFTQHTQQDGMFSSKESISSQEFATLYPTLLEALEIYGNTEHATYRGTDFIADVFYDNTKDGASFGPTVATLKYFQQMVSESPLAKSDVGCEGWREVMQPCRLAVNKIVRDIDEGEIKLESVDWDKDRTQIIGKFAETVYELKRHHREWAEITQVIPNEALVVVALAITIATQGTGGKMFAAAVSNMTGGAMVATGMGTAMASGGFTAICASAATNFLATGDPMATAKSLVSNKGIRSLAISVASAGLCHGIGGVLDINTNPSLAALADPSKQVVFTDFLKANVLKTVIETPLQSLIGGVPVEEAVKDGLKSLGVNMVSAYFAHHIGKIYGDQEKGMSYLEHKGLHGLLGGAAGWLINSTQKGLISGAIGSIVSEVVMDERRDIARDKALDIMAQAEKEGVSLDGPTFQQRLYDGLSGELGFAKLSGATVSALLGQHASVAAQTATNAIENNAIALAVGIGLAAFEVYQIIRTAQDEGPKAALEKVAVDGTITIVTAGASKVVYEVSKLSAPMAKMVWATYVAENPAFAQVASRVFEPLGKGITRAKALYHQADEALASGSSRLYNKMFGKKATSKTVDGLDLAETSITPKSSHEDWNLGPVLRGEKIEQSLGQNLPKNFPTIDKFSFHDGVATSIKSIDLSSKTYKNTAALNNKLKQYVDVLAGFDGKYWHGVNIDRSQIQSRVLDLAIPHAGTSAQKSTIDQIINYGLTKGVTVNPIIH